MNHFHSTMAALLVLVLGFSTPTLAQQPNATQSACERNCDGVNACGCDDAGCPSCCNSAQCQPLRPRIQCGKCNGSCFLKVEPSTKEKSCFKVEAKQICIPRVRFPWQPKDKCKGCDGCDRGGCCTNHCGRVKTVLVLKKHKYECPACKYTWEVASCGACDNTSCDGCSDGQCGADVVPPPDRQVQRRVQPMVLTQPGTVSERGQAVGNSKPVILSAEQWRKLVPAKPDSSTKTGTNR